MARAMVTIRKAFFYVSDFTQAEQKYPDSLLRTLSVLLLRPWNQKLSWKWALAICLWLNFISWVNYYNSFFPVTPFTICSTRSVLCMPAFFFTRKEEAGGTIVCCCPAVDLYHSTTPGSETKWKSINITII